MTDSDIELAEMCMRLAPEAARYVAATVPPRRRDAKTVVGVYLRYLTDELSQVRRERDALVAGIEVSRAEDAARAQAIAELAEFMAAVEQCRRAGEQVVRALRGTGGADDA